MNLRTRLIVALTLLSLVIPASANRTSAAAELKGTAEDRLKNDLKYLADDKLEGRGVGTDGLNLAADFIKKQFKQAGLDVTALDGDAFQKFTMVTGTKLLENNSLKFVGPEDKAIELKLEEDYNVCSFGGSGKFSGEIVFGGYAINAKEASYKDFGDVDVKGKIVIVMRRTPQQANHKSPFASGHGVSRHASIQTKVSVCSTAGAAAILFVNDPYSISSASEKAVDSANNAVVKVARELAKLEPTDETFADTRQKLNAALERVNNAHGDAHTGGFDTLMKFGYAGNGKDGAIPVVHITQAKCDELLKAALDKSLADLEAEIDTDLKPRTQVLKGWTVTGETSLERVRTEVKNVIGVLEGEGPLADETIVVGAHYDHVGMGGDGSLAPGVIEVHNGADDNGSGTVALIEIARQLAARKEPLPRRVVFIAFTAEEKGLIGSAKYVEKPLFPLEKTIAMFNMDMVGRLRDDKLTVFGIGTSPMFKDDITRFGEAAEFQLSLKPEGFGPSDQSSFYAKKIPVLHFFTNTHSDYHRPGDDWEKINFKGIQRISHLFRDFVIHTAETQKRPEYLEVAGNADIERQGSRPYFGSIPDFSEEGEGYAISGVSPKSPAAEGGLKGGDRIVQFGESKVTDLSDFDLALRNFSGGDEVDVTVLRDGQRVKLKVTLEKPR
ncbi:MAG: M20/M25/M40 family metallo-hydrolase [Rhodopirellula sp.]|nr:M20/M25/M40 family metallo-hydrolase [Rhodopirellula sp.]